MSNMVSFDEQTYRKLKSEYQKSVKNNVDVFVFEGNELLTNYAKYLIEYLKTKFEK